ncbi:hypothetical protein [Deinococcus pimensis]|uniref:hypothetical protein n=1 Tax=Deinococcus pimensis TaxID=309888 RepID=UPI0004B65575|nr:hypothetical protein [Deinococcus pimensis]
MPPHAEHAPPRLDPHALLASVVTFLTPVPLPVTLDTEWSAREAWATVRPVLAELGVTLRLTSVWTEGLYASGRRNHWSFAFDLVEVRAVGSAQLSLRQEEPGGSVHAAVGVNLRPWITPGSVAHVLAEGGAVPASVVELMNRAVPGLGEGVLDLDRQGGFSWSELSRRWSERPGLPQAWPDSTTAYEAFRRKGVDFEADAEDKTELTARIGPSGVPGWELLPSFPARRFLSFDDLARADDG